MKLYIMKRDALETLKANLPQVFSKYYTEPSNEWIEKICGDNPFVEFMDVSEFQLANLDANLKPGEIDLLNCKILYEKLQFLSESKASDERLWAGLTHTTFYGYMKKRWGYGPGKKLGNAEKEAGAISTRFFYRHSGRRGFYRNTLSKCWWVGHNTYNPHNADNHFEMLDIIGSNDFNSKINELFNNHTFSSNPNVMAAIIDALRTLNATGKKLLVKEHIRPAMSFLNAVGGSVVIDCLEKKVVSDMFISAIEAIMEGDIPALDLDGSSTEDDDINYNEDDIANNEDDIATVLLGCKIHLRNNAGETKLYKYDLINDSMPKNLEVFTGKKVGDLIKLEGQIWTIEDITS